MRFLLICLLTLTAFSLSAQAEVTYRLRVPDAEEYVHEAEKILEVATLSYSLSQYTMYPVAAAAMVDEVNWRLLARDRLTYRQLETLYRYFVALRIPRYSTMPHESWLRELIRLWLNESLMDLAELDQVKTETIQFDNYHIEVAPLRTSLGNYGGILWGYYIRVIDEPGGRQIGYIAVVEDGQYLLPELPASMDSELLASGDLNNDDLPDIAYLYSEHIGNSYNSGDLIIATLRDDNQFEQLDSLHYFTGGYEFPPLLYDWWLTSVGASGTTSIVQSQTLGTNWSCSFIQVKLFGWNEEARLVNQSTENVYPSTFGCLILQAEQAMWSHDYAEAVKLYEQAFATGTPIIDLLPHAQIRLGLAYLVTNQSDKAEELFSELVTSESDFAQTVLATYERDPRLLPVCQTMYRYAFDGPERLQSNGVVETYDGGFNRFEFGMASFDLENATCDLVYHLDTQLNTMVFPSDESPLALIEGLGLAVADSIETDFDLDGESEWLLWLDEPGIDPLFFTPTGENHYQLSRPELSSSPYWTLTGRLLKQPSADNQYHTLMLPNNIEQVLINIDFDEDQYRDAVCVGWCTGMEDQVICENSDSTFTSCQAGDLTLWRLRDGKLVNMLIASLYKPQGLDVVFPVEQMRREIHAAASFSEGPYVISVKPATYLWNDDAQTYILLAESEPVNPQVPDEFVPAATQEPFYSLNNFYPLRSAFIEEDYALVVHIVDVALTNKSDTDAEQWEYAFRYYRALALEALNRPDEALAEYVAIYEAAPDSAWGMLAALHLEVVETE